MKLTQVLLLSILFLAVALSGNASDDKTPLFSESTPLEIVLEMDFQSVLNDNQIQP